METEYYVLARGEETKIVSVVKGGDPLYGNGSWDLKSGPHPSWDSAADSEKGKNHASNQ